MILNTLLIHYFDVFRQQIVISINQTQMKGDNLTTQAKTYIYNHCFSENSPSDLLVQF